MTALRETPFNLVYLDTVYAKVQARNSRGWSLESLEGTGP